ncbi:transcription factor JUNGBRUNNEN 1-like [Senna tora]|uniref:Transcription factor JUNGBRUNNEN 1-like n=1 Tax=Senna tora TaxID=362788 RepID=A0A834WZ28_9FABA|nr:transcription factor JUNGBRUNNEN 1-like [Senna tora]
MNHSRNVKSSSTGEKEGYFYCKRGRKYRNSIRPNRVTGSGFWKATGIDKPVYDNNNDSIIGLKKTLVYYRGSAGKGTKTEWMMHEFRHPPTTTATANNKTHINNNINIPQEAEIWTLCRIFKRNASHRKCAPADHWRHFGGNKRHSSQDQKSNNSTVTTVDQSSAITTDNDKPQTYINFGGTHSDNNNDTFFQQEHKPLINNNNNRINYYYNHHHQVATNNNSSNDLFAFENSSWDELGSVVQFPL